MKKKSYNKFLLSGESLISSRDQEKHTHKKKQTKKEKKQDYACTLNIYI